MYIDEYTLENCHLNFTHSMYNAGKVQLEKIA